VRGSEPAAAVVARAAQRIDVPRACDEEAFGVRMPGGEFQSLRPQPVEGQRGS